MKTRWLVSVLFLIPAAGAGYITWLSWCSGDDGKWLFGVFTAFFLVLSAAPFLPKSKRPPPLDAPSTGTRFVPHWFMLLAFLVSAVVVIAALTRVFLWH